MSYLKNTPNALKGAIVSFGLQAIPSVSVFQYNPQQLTRTLTSRTSQHETQGEAAVRMQGAPIETIALEIELDATDQLAEDKQAFNLGIYPQLSALEILLYPDSKQVALNTALLNSGSIEVLAPSNSNVLTLLIWGNKRIVPIKINNFSIIEEAYDEQLNPIRATVSLTVKVLSYDDLSVKHPGYYTFFSHHVIKEAMAALSQANINSIF